MSLYLDLVRGVLHVCYLSSSPPIELLWLTCRDDMSVVASRLTVVGPA
jgi:hypothetical protein